MTRQPLVWPERQRSKIRRLAETRIFNGLHASRQIAQGHQICHQSYKRAFLMMMMKDICESQYENTAIIPDTEVDKLKS
jgi:hypothetical protein